MTALTMRSKLFVPGTRPELFAKATRGDADALSFDLEDSVVAARKNEARVQVAAFIAGDVDLRASEKVVIVRTNAAGSPHFEQDLRALVPSGVHLLNIPKVESAADVHHVAAWLDRIEVEAGVAVPVRLLINIETPRALRQAAAIACSHPRVAGLQLGLGDLFEPYGIDRRVRANLHAAMFAVRLAAAEAGAFACDGAFADFSDDEGFRAEAGMARDLGFIGKSCIHPSQVALANAVFLPTDAEFAAALRIVEASRTARESGQDAFAVDGRMVDPPFLRRAEAIVASRVRAA